MLPKLTPSADNYFMGMLYIGSAACKDPEVQHSAIATGNENIPVTPICHNMLVKPMFQKQKDWSKREIQLLTAEEVVLAHIDKLVEKGVYYSAVTLYTSGKPSFQAVRECAFRGLKKIIYGDMNNMDFFNNEEWKLTLQLATEYEVKMTAFSGNVSWVRDRIQVLESIM